VLTQSSTYHTSIFFEEVDGVQLMLVLLVLDLYQTSYNVTHLPIITIASIRGRTRGIGAEFVEGLDIRFGSREKMILGQPEVGAALIPGSGGTVYLPLLVGRARALEIIACSDDYDADTAERYGWINRAIPDTELDAFVDRFARRIASFEKKVLTEAKRLVNRASLLPDDAHLVAAGETFLRMLTWPETQSGSVITSVRYNP
jgi:enoyl-CoA hydratase/carnithine racemase